MKKRYSLPLLAASVFSTVAMALPSGFFARTSSLDEGRWVKISVDSTGVYRIPYDTLRALGFEIPEAVSVFGRGARRGQDQFVTDGNIQISGDVTPLPVLRRDDEILFFAVGPMWQKVIQAPDSLGGPHFARDAKNVYSKRGYFLLSDARPGADMDTTRVQLTELSELPQPPYVYAYETHDRDLRHGFNASGQVYFGEDMSSQRDLNFVLAATATLPHSPVVVEADAYADDGAQANFYAISMGGIKKRFAFPKYKSSVLEDVINAPLVAKMDGYYGGLRINIEGGSPVSAAYLDYWTTTYRAFSDQAAAARLNMAVPMADGDSVRLPMPTSGQLMVWDVADPLAPLAIPVDGDGDARWIDLTSRQDGRLPRPFVFNPETDTRSPRIEGEVVSASLHTRASQGADLLIITVPMLNEQAQRLARIHQEHDGMSVMVANVGDIYNEYNEGTPSVMAYRALVRHLREVYPGRVLNVLLFGPMRSESIGIFSELNPDDFIIAYQAPTFTGDGESHNVNDFIGMMDDTIDTKIEYATIQVGVGVLPCLSVHDAQLVIDKIERYIDEPNYDLVTNKLLGMAGTGDSQMHTKQCKSLSASINNFYGRSLLFSPLIGDAFTKADIEDHTIEMFNSDYPLVYYMGHGTSFAFNAAAPLFVKGSVARLRNNILPFFMYGTCDITNFDRGSRGLSESMLFESTDGIIGGVMSTRKAYSTQNEAMLRLFSQYLVQPKTGSASLRQVKTLGQAFAEAKTQLRTQHENTFQLVGDPALRLVVPVLATLPSDASNIVLTPGGRTLIEGSITTRDGQPVNDFCGRITAKIMAPSVSELCPNYITGDSNREEIVYADQVVATSFGTVENGHFTVEIDTPVSQFLRDGVSTSVALSAYDKVSRRAASSKHVVRVETPEEGVDPDMKDTEAPVVTELRYDPVSQSVFFTVTDNRSLHLDQYSLTDAMELYVDGERYSRLANNVSITPGTPVTVAGCVPARGMTPGIHMLRLKAVDYAGNAVTANSEFRIGDDMRRCLLVPESTVTSSGMRFTLEGTGVAEPRGRLLIADTSGLVRLSEPFYGTEIYTMLQNDRGIRLGDGRYRAWVICDAPGYESSQPVDFVIVR